MFKQLVSMIMAGKIKHVGVSNMHGGYGVCGLVWLYWRT